MKVKQNYKNHFCLGMVLLSLLILPNLTWSQEFYRLPKANYTLEGVPRSQLEVVKKIESDFDEDLFFAMPSTLAAGPGNFLYVYDQKMVRIFVFENYKFIGQTLSRGAGPNETPNPMNKELYVAPDGKLLCYDGVGDKILCYDKRGKYINERRLHRISRSQRHFPPVYDQSGCLYVLSTNNGIVDKLDQNLKLVSTYLDVRLNHKFIYYRPDFEGAEALKGKSSPRGLWQEPNSYSVFFDVLKNGKLFIFLHRSATVFIFDGKKLERQFSIYIDRVMRNYQRGVLKSVAEKKKRQPDVPLAFQKHMFSSCFLDKDAPFFYLQINGKNNENTLFQFDFFGKLTRIFGNCQEGAIFKTKCDGLFYGLAFENFVPVIFKPKKEKIN